MSPNFFDLFSKKAPASPAVGDGSDAPAGDKRIVFMGTPEIAAGHLAALITAGYQIAGVVSKPDKAVGREHTVHVSPVKHLAQERGLPVLTPARLDEEFVKALRQWRPDLIVVVAYGKILPKDILDLPAFGCLNVHASLLPRWRGASPIQNALLAGDTETGVTLMLLDEGMDTGPVIAQSKVSISDEDTTPTLLTKLTQAGTELLTGTLPAWFARSIQPVPQNNDDATLCQLIERHDGQVVWSESARQIWNRYRALFPWPGLYTYLKKNDGLLRFKLLDISYQRNSPEIRRALGEVFEIGDEIGVQTGEGVVFLKRVQLEGKKPLSIREFLAGSPELIGSIFH